MNDATDHHDADLWRAATSQFPRHVCPGCGEPLWCHWRTGDSDRDACQWDGAGDVNIEAAYALLVADAIAAKMQLPELPQPDGFRYRYFGRGVTAMGRRVSAGIITYGQLVKPEPDTSSVALWANEAMSWAWAEWQVSSVHRPDVREIERYGFGDFAYRLAARLGRDAIDAWNVRLSPSDYGDLQYLYPDYGSSPLVESTSTTAYGSLVDLFAKPLHLPRFRLFDAKGRETAYRRTD